jgi:hypothetical protein
MRRSGKFDDAMDSHAAMWLPPRKSAGGDGTAAGGSSTSPGLARNGAERWIVYTAAAET